MKSDNLKLKNKKAFVTGSSRGIGKEIALSLAENGANVGIHFYQDFESAKETSKRIKELGRNSSVFMADLLKAEEIDLLAENVKKKFGNVDILVNNFGPLVFREWEEIDYNEWENLFRANLLSAVFLTKKFLPDMRKNKWGRIINIGYSRVENLVGFQKILPYSIAKVGLLLFTRSVAQSEARYGITSNMVSPGIVESDSTFNQVRIPAGRKARFKDISEAVIFLCSDSSSYITGTNLIVGGGWKV
ncbi:MAG: SDR family oxidoreductase [Acidobacteriota bacterium]